MPSSQKTPFLGLNRFIGSDKPKMEDVNFDNNQLDQKCQEHFEDSVAHVTAEEREKWNAAGGGSGSGLKIVEGSYTGDGQSSQLVPLEAEPKILVIYPENGMLVMLEPSTDLTLQYSGIMTPQASTLGMEWDVTGFRVYQTSGLPSNGKKSTLNMSGTTYHYIAFY